jgi:hypothetical protein
VQQQKKLRVLTTFLLKHQKRRKPQFALADQHQLLSVLHQHSVGNELTQSQQTWFVEGGVCGFASVVIKPARGKFVAELKKRKIGYVGYYGGYSVSSWEFAPSIRQDQSYERACAAAAGAVKVLQSYGINAYVDSRID